VLTDTVLEVATPQCVAEDFDGEIVVLNMDSGVYFSVRDWGATLWRDLAAGQSVETLVGLANGNVKAANAIRAFIENVLAESLMRPVAHPVKLSDAPSLDVTLISGNAAQVLEAFHDMKSLLLLDPVHEVDSEVGWPKLPEA